MTKGWSRRGFVGAAAGAALLATLGRSSATGRGQAGATGALMLFDPRFATARAVASRLGQGCLQPIHGDPTELALHLARASAHAAFRIRGVTSEAVPFCLAALLPGTKLAQRRIDRDLFVWTLERKA